MAEQHPHQYIEQQSSRPGTSQQVCGRSYRSRIDFRAHVKAIMKYTPIITLIAYPTCSNIGEKVSSTINPSTINNTVRIVKTIQMGCDC
mmetsp:Transcript_37864/g.42395  ORF Transcript_37864/g.42395 Transcript_37864/m.42395 type:complete len:89 (+) Transcript_37864:139-405(+)